MSVPESTDSAAARSREVVPADFRYEDMAERTTMGRMGGPDSGCRVDLQASAASVGEREKDR